MTQDEALKILKTGANVFLTGEPGSGKTHTINKYVEYLRSCGIEPAITASTGIAATHIGGLTIHSWSGVGIRRRLSPYDLDQIGQNKKLVQRVSDTHVLIIDEVSMLSAGMLTMIDSVCREIKRNSLPFGGLQVIFVGDFFQLPPIEQRDFHQDDEGLFDDTAPSGRFAFSSPAWNTMNPLVCYLSEQHRQEDETFLSFLSAVREATVDETHWELLRTRYSPKPRPEKTGGVTQLFSHNANVDNINDEELEKLDGEIRVFEMLEKGPAKLTSTLKRGCLSPETLVLKVGARVMFTKNDIGTHRYVNGTLGTVSGFTLSGCPVVKTTAGKTIYAEPDEWRIEDGGRELARITQTPLRLAWAMTVHKSQGMSLDSAHMDLSGAFEYGQGYVALSRVRTLSGLSLAGLNKRALEVHPEVRIKDSFFRELSDKARETTTAMPKKELETMHTNFIRACGGKIGAGRKVKKVKEKIPTIEITRSLLSKKLSIAEMAKERSITSGTILNHLEKLVDEKKIDQKKDLAHLKGDAKRFETIKKAFEKVYKKEKSHPLTPTREILGDDFTFEELRTARLFITGK